MSNILNLNDGINVVLPADRIPLVSNLTLSNEPIPTVENENIRLADLNNGYTDVLALLSKTKRTVKRDVWLGPNGMTIGKTPHVSIADVPSLRWMDVLKAANALGDLPWSEWSAAGSLPTYTGTWSGTTHMLATKRIVDMLMQRPMTVLDATRIDWTGGDTIYSNATASMAEGVLILHVPILWTQLGNYALRVRCVTPDDMIGVHYMYWHGYYSPIFAYMSTIIAEKSWLPVIQGATRNLCYDGGALNVSGTPIKNLSGSSPNFTLNTDPHIYFVSKNVLQSGTNGGSLPTTIGDAELAAMADADQLGMASYNLRRYSAYVYGFPDIAWRYTIHGTPSLVNGELHFADLQAVTMDWTGALIALVDESMSQANKDKISNYEIVSCLRYGDTPVPADWVSLFAVYQDLKDNGTDLRTLNCVDAQDGHEAKSFARVERESVGKSTKVMHRMCAIKEELKVKRVQILNTQGALSIKFLDVDGVQQSLATENQIEALRDSRVGIFTYDVTKLTQDLISLYGFDPRVAAENPAVAAAEQAVDERGSAAAMQKLLTLPTLDDNEKAVLIAENFAFSRDPLTGYMLGSLAYAKATFTRLKRVLV